MSARAWTRGLTDLAAVFDTLLRARRRSPPADVLEGVGDLAVRALQLLAAESEVHDFVWKGSPGKRYSVVALRRSPVPFSRPANAALFERDAELFHTLWARISAGLASERSQAGIRVSGVSAQAIDRAFYTAVLAYAMCMDLGGDRRRAGTLLEITIRSAVELLSGRRDVGEVRLPIPGEPDRRVRVDMSFPPGTGRGVTLVVASKFSTRERISQAFVHQLFLDRLSPGNYRSIMTICSENNVFGPKGVAGRRPGPAVCWAQDTLVPGTIAMYQRYVAEMAGLYYLDPPAPYLQGRHPGLPPIRRFSDLLRADLAALLKSRRRSGPHA
jgi:hypothetical protein